MLLNTKTNTLIKILSKTWRGPIGMLKPQRWGQYSDSESEDKETTPYLKETRWHECEVRYKVCTSAE